MWLYPAIAAFALLAAALGDVFNSHFDTDLQGLSHLPPDNTSNPISTYTPSASDLSAHSRRRAGPHPAPADDTTWSTSKCKGRKFLAQMSYSDADVGRPLPVPQASAQSPWYYGKSLLCYAATLPNTLTGHLNMWGYVLSGVSDAYRNFEAGGYWGVADFFRHLGISDRCVEEGGMWRNTVVTHYRPRLGPQDQPTEMQRYTGPDGRVRRVGLL
jgi:hypothetical protein